MIKDIHPNQIILVARQWSEWCENNSFGNLKNYLKGCKVVSTNDLKGWDNRLLRLLRLLGFLKCLRFLGFLRS